MTAAVTKVGPQPGPQEAFMACPADIVVYGGAAGPGKTWGLVYEASRNVHVAGYGAILFRRTKPELVGSGSMWEEALKIYPLRGGRPREHRLDWKFKVDGSTPLDATIEFDGMQYENDKLSHQGKQYAFIGFDELTHFTEGQFWYLVGRARSTCGVRPYIRATCNPDPDSFVRRLIDWWIGEEGFPIPERAGVIRWFVRLDEELAWFDSEELARQAVAHMPEDSRPIPQSFTFIPAKLDDNKRGDPTYRARLLALGRVDRERLLHGNWNIRPSAGSYFQRRYFKCVQTPPHPKDILRRVRFWDKAATEPNSSNPDPDWTVGVLMSVTKDKLYTIEHVARLRESPGGVEDAVTTFADQDGRKTVVGLYRDPAQAGKVENFHQVKALLGHVVKSLPATRNVETLAKPVSAAAEHGFVQYVDGPWADVFFRTLEGFPEAMHDDDVAALAGAFELCTSSQLMRLKDMTRWASAR